MGLKEIKEESKESMESVRSLKPGMIYKEKQQEITDLGMLSGFKPQDNYFILGSKKAKKDLAKNTIREKAENDTLFREILNQEIRGYDEKGRET